jgi:hypothetical protein
MKIVKAILALVLSLLMVSCFPQKQLFYYHDYKSTREFYIDKAECENEALYVLGLPPNAPTPPPNSGKTVWSALGAALAGSLPTQQYYANLDKYFGNCMTAKGWVLR